MRSRDLLWDGCLNVRDLGGLPLAEGGTTRFGQIVRADNLRRLSPAGWSSVRAYGVRRIVDLRFVRERPDEEDVPADLDVVAVSLFGDHDPAEAVRHEAVVRRAIDDVDAIELFYTETLDTRGTQIVSALHAVASAADGAVAIHCFVGKDRTGILSALLLRLAGVPADVVAEDYALSGPVVGPLVDDWIAAADDEHERAFRRRISSAPAAGLERVLARVRERWGGEEEYLLAMGATPADLAHVRGRLVG